MAVSINWEDKIIYVPQSYLDNVDPGIYELDVNQFRLDLKALEETEEGAVFDTTHNHNTTVTLSGVTYARTFEIINGYTIEFEDGSYTVKCIGANHNLADVKIVNSVSLLIGNSAGLIQIVSGSGVTEQDKLDIADAVWDEQKSGHTTTSSYGKIAQDLEVIVRQIKALQELGL